MIKIGDIVSIIDEDRQGKVVAIKPGNIVVVADEDAFELEYELHELIVIGDRSKEDKVNLEYERSLDSGENNKDKVHRKLNPVKHKKDVVEVDLHIEELVEDHRGWTNAEIIAYQLDKFESVLNAAFQTRKRKIVAIHGRGDGILRSEIRKKLQDYPGIEVHDASYKTYGQGATEILLHK
jgi:dsDNA-specific endonuclease/ATPase MutS2